MKQAKQSIDWGHLFRENTEEILAQHWTKMVWQCFAKYIPHSGVVLEIGCGTGRIIGQACAHLRVRGVGLDISLTALTYAQGLAKYLGVQNCSFIEGSGFALPFPDDTFDAVLSEGVIEHFSPMETERMVQEHVRVCKHGGKVIISVPNLFNLPLTYHKLRVGERFHAYPERSYTLWGLARLLHHCGLRPVAYDGFAPFIGMEWYILSFLKFRFLDRLLAKSPTLSSLLGYECLVVGVKI